MPISEYDCLRITHALFNLTRAYETQIERGNLYQEAGLAIQDLSLLVLLGLFAPITSHQLTEKMDISAGMTSIYVQRWVEKGLLYKEQDKNDRRNWWLSLTEKGSHLYDALVASTVENTHILLSALDEDEQDKFYLMLEKIIQQIPKVLPDFQIKDRLY